jgi:NitT/TauT family transport system ATP-binding protein
VLLDGEPITGPRPKEIGVIFQEANLLPWRNLGQNIEFPFEIKGGKPDRTRIASLVEATGLAGFEGAMPRELSGGMQQRASIVRALAQDPAVLLMDEPFGALDAFTRDEMNLLLLELWSETRKTVVFVTHNIGEAIFLADRVVVMTSRPGRLARIYDIDLPRPRTIEMTFEPHFIAQIQEIKRAVEAGGPHALEVE